MKTGVCSYVMILSRLAGTGSVELQATRCLSPASLCGVVLRTHQVGSTEVILQWTTGLFNAKYVITGNSTGLLTTAACGQIIFMSGTVAASTFTTFQGHLLACYATVPTDYQVKSHHFPCIDLQITKVSAHISKKSIRSHEKTLKIFYPGNFYVRFKRLKSNG